MLANFSLMFIMLILALVHDSPLYLDAENSESVLFTESTYIIGDAANPLKTWLVTGFKNDG